MRPDHEEGSFARARSAEDVARDRAELHEAARRVWASLPPPERAAWQEILDGQRLDAEAGDDR